MSQTLTLNLPKTIKFDERELVLILAAKLYEQGKLSLGQSAELAGFSKRAFMEVLGNYGVSVFNYSADDLESDLENAKNYSL
jgi:predicted HTH domain antitoxin